jgi:hypothetical protein
VGCNTRSLEGEGWERVPNNDGKAGRGCEETHGNPGRILKKMAFAIIPVAWEK